MSVAQPQVSITVPQKAQLLYGSPTRSDALTNQPLSLGGSVAPSDQALSIDNAAKSADVFSSNQSLEQSTTNISKSGKTKTVAAEANGDVVYNIVADYDWTLSKNKKVEATTIPYIKMREFDIVASNVATSLYATLGAASDMVAANKEAISKVVGTATGASAEATNSLTKFGSKAVKAVASIAESAASGIQSAATYVQKELGISLPAEQYGLEWSEDLKKTYGQLYLRTPTNAVYKLPYFSKDMLRTYQSFTDSANSAETSITASVITGAIESVSKAMKEGTTIPSIVEPGVYIQRPKYFQFSNAAATVSVTFTLFNTVTPDSYKQNSEFIKRLLLKNLPQRMNKVVVYPPAIYEVTIPGRAFYPYCYINSLTVTHEGTKRIISIDGGDEIVPDAYTIRMEICSLTSDTNNFYVQQMGTAGIDMGTRKIVGPIQLKENTQNDDAVKYKNVSNSNQVTTKMQQSKNFTGAAFMGMGGVAR